MSRRTDAVAAVVAIALCARSADAAPRTRAPNVPCAGCVSSWSEGSDPAPLLVLLHGDWGNDATALHAVWEPLVAAQGIALLSLACPKDRGCQGSYWKWNGPPEWIDDQIAALAQKRTIDRTRMWIAGWSGGATYIGFRSLDLEKRFSAFVIHGGGAPPGTTDCGSNTVGAYFLVGASNPLHGLQVGLHDYYVACKQETQWTVLAGADHDVEWKALSSHGPAIVRWLLDHRRVAANVTPASDAGATSQVEDAAAPADAAPAAAASTAPAVVPPSRHSGCGCAVAGEAEPRFAVALAALVGFVSWLRARSRTARPGRRATASRR